jgi:outer membrane protein TolC
MLRTAKIYREASELERKAILNDILLDALRVYWNWSQQYQVCQVLEETMQVTRQRVQWVKTAYQLGDRAAIDTVEAFTQFQQLELQYNTARMDFQNYQFELSSFLWNEKLEPQDLDNNTIPSAENKLLEKLTDPLSTLLETAVKNHPELGQYPYKLKALEVERKWKFQELLPEARFQYNQLGRGFNLLGADSGPLFGNNFQYGLSLGIPLLLSKGRAEYRKAKLKIMETRLQQDNKKVLVEMKLRAIYNEWQTLRRQVDLQQQALNNFLALQRAEEAKFRNGESSLFLVNARENKSLEAKQKLLELKNKYSFTGYKLQWAMGGLGSSLP